MGQFSRKENWGMNRVLTGIRWQATLSPILALILNGLLRFWPKPISIPQPSMPEKHRWREAFRSSRSDQLPPRAQEQPHPCAKPAGHRAPDRGADIQHPHTATREIRPRGRPSNPPQSRAPPKPESALPPPRNRQHRQPRSPITKRNRPSKRNRSTPFAAIA